MFSDLTSIMYLKTLYFRENTPDLDEHSDSKGGLALKDMRPLNIEQAIDSKLNGSTMDTITERAVIFKGDLSRLINCD